jgi:hypothetical protein
MVVLIFYMRDMQRKPEERGTYQIKTILLRLIIWQQIRSIFVPMITTSIFLSIFHDIAEQRGSFARVTTKTLELVCPLSRDSCGLSNLLVVPQCTIILEASRVLVPSACSSLSAIVKTHISLQRFLHSSFWVSVRH